MFEPLNNFQLTEMAFKIESDLALHAVGRRQLGNDKLLALRNVVRMTTQEVNRRTPVPDDVSFDARTMRRAADALKWAAEEINRHVVEVF